MPDPAFRLSVVEAPVIGMPKGARLSWAVPSVHSPLDTPPAVRVGDFDLDGFPDALVGLQDEDGKPHVALLRNQRGHGLEAAYWRTTQSGSYARQRAARRALRPRRGSHAQRVVPAQSGAVRCTAAHGAADRRRALHGNANVGLVAGICLPAPDQSTRVPLSRARAQLCQRSLSDTPYCPRGTHPTAPLPTPSAPF